MGKEAIVSAYFFLIPLFFSVAAADSPVDDDCLYPTPLCPKNEEAGCRNPCPPETCMTLYAAFRCVANQTCVQGCFCKKGFLRTTTNGTCVLRNQCLPLECVNDPHAVKGCGDRCGKTCADFNDKSKACPLGPCKKNGCDCQDGFIYDKNVGRCVKPKECTKQCTKPHEIYSSCLLGECGPKTCKDLGKPLACAAVAEPCAGGCTCEAGYVRDAKGNCIDVKECPSCGGDPNAESGCGNPCGKTCDSQNINKTDLVCPQYCEVNGCDCKDGYLLNTDTKKCTLIKDCPKPPQVCPKNEEPGCRNSCPPETCITLYAAFDCIENQTCVQGCFCKKGFLRTTTNGTCIPRDQCLPLECVNDPHAVKGCGDRCGKTCADFNDKSKACPLGPCKKNGCDCQDGFIYDKNVGRCVKPKECTKQCTKPHEIYSSCLLGECGPKTCEDLGKPLACAAVAEPCAGGCTCEAGYVRDCEGNCIDVKECPSCGGDPNAESGCGNPCGKTCDSQNINKTDLVCPQYCEVNGCDCKDGYLLNTDTKKCTLIKDCPKPPQVCPKNEEPGCRNSCPPETCITLYAAFKCIGNQTCVQGCFCKKGFLRTTRNGTCIPRDQCLPLECVNDPHAVKGCGDRCGKTCADFNDKSKACPLGSCKKNGCDCQDGFIYDKNVGRCVKPKECTKQCTKPHEIYSSCLLGECGPKTCADLGKPLACAAVAEPCAGGCTCEAGYVRDAKGNCIDVKECPSCGGDPNAESGCGNPCGKTCDSQNINKTDLVCPQYCEVNGCDCKDGYLLNTDTKKCTLIKDCPKFPQVCPKNEEPRCRNSCPPETCITLYAAFLCIENQTCVQGCFCKKGFLRTTTNGTCIPRDQCLPLECVNDPHAVKGCGDRCGKTCADFNDKSKACPLGPCKKNECDCQDGFIYDKNVERCVKPKECTKQCTKPHEIYSSCLLGECGPKTCEDLGKPLACAAVAEPCAGGCTCEAGYVRDAKGHCIDVKDCPSCGGDPNAESGCGNPCGKTCDSQKINKTDLVCPQYCEVNGCDCKDGYLLNTDTKKCTLIKDCPKPLICNKPHERYIDCLAGQCTPKTCDDLGKSLPCPFIRGPCPGGCICDEGYLRDAKGTCIKLEKCPPKSCGTNETWVSPCNGLCSDSFCPRNDKPIPPCEPLQPCYPGCHCKLNYKLNATRNCILAPECPPVKCTRQNEVWDSCPSACLAENCEDINNQPKACNTLIWLCSPRCVCAKGHFRNKEGLCIPAAQCPVQCTKPNEKYIDCLEGQCNPKTCDELIKPAPCPRVRPPCLGGCICVDGFVRNDKGVCIKKENCPKTCNGPNEQYTDCVYGQCTPTTCKEVVKMPTCPLLKPGPCPGGCICQRGYVRSNNGTCVAIKDCPEAGVCTAKNETWVQCAANCAPAYCPKDDQPQPICFLPAGCPPGCHCKPNYRIDTNNKCRLASECPPVPCTRPNEVYSSCPPNRVTSCAMLGTTPLPDNGPKICNPGCICEEGFYTNDTGICVPECDCPSDSDN